MRDARAEGGSKHLSLEGAQGTDSPGGAPDTFLPPRTSPCFCLDGVTSGMRVIVVKVESVATSAVPDRIGKRWRSRACTSCRKTLDQSDSNSRIFCLLQS